MAERRIFEKSLELSENARHISSIIGDYTVDKVHLRVDDTIGPMFDLKFEEEEGVDFTPNLVNLEIAVYDATLNMCNAIIYSRTLMQFKTLACPIFRRYRTPFLSLEQYIGGSIPEHLIKERHHGSNFYIVKTTEGPKVGMVYKGNPQHDIRIGERVLVKLLAPYKLTPEKSKITLQFIELMGHLGPEEIPVG